VKISELKNQLSRYLDAVRRGEEVEMLDRKTPVARIVPIESRAGNLEPNIEMLTEEGVRLGILRRGAGKIPGYLLKGRPPGKPGALAELLESRRASR
jgi:prevent-host-death family protein